MAASAPLAVASIGATVRRPMLVQSRAAVDHERAGQQRLTTSEDAQGASLPWPSAVVRGSPPTEVSCSLLLLVPGGTEGPLGRSLPSGARSALPVRAVDERGDRIDDLPPKPARQVMSHTGEGDQLCVLDELGVARPAATLISWSSAP